MPPIVHATPPAAVPKCPTGIDGLDELLGGGLPLGRTTLVSGGPGCGKTLLGAEFLVKGATVFGEPGVLLTFEETEDEVARNVASLGFDLRDLKARRLLEIDHVRLDRDEVQEAGDFDLEALFVRLGHAIVQVGAKRVVLDPIDGLFSSFQSRDVLRTELRRLFRWLNDRRITALVSAERGDRSLTRHHVEEYVSDCVIFLDHRVEEQIATRRLRVVKYRGSAHGTNEYPFLIDDTGFTVFPLTSAALTHDASQERISSGILELDGMLGGGMHRGSSVFLTGTPGTGKTTLALQILQASCARGEKALLFAFEESPAQIVRNARSVGIDLGGFLESGLLTIRAARTAVSGLEMHLAAVHREVRSTAPRIVAMDPISKFKAVGMQHEANALLARMVDHLKMLGITTVFTSLTRGGAVAEEREETISPIMDSWILLRDIEQGGERNRVLDVLKSRGSDHSNQIREYLLTGRGFVLLPTYVGPEGVVTGSARLAQAVRDHEQALALSQDIERRGRALERRREDVELQPAAVRAAFEAETAELAIELAEAEARRARIATDRAEMARLRRVRPEAGDTPKSP